MPIATAAWGCGVEVLPEKEIFTPLWPGETASVRERWPLSAKAETTSYGFVQRLFPRPNLAVVPIPPDSRTLATTRLGGSGSAAEGAGAEGGGSPEEHPGEPSHDSLIIFPERPEVCHESLLYAGHCAFGCRSATGFQLVHHVRLLAVNHEDVPLSLPLAYARLRSPTTGLRCRAALTGDGEPLHVLEVPAGGHAVVHLFFFQDRLPLAQSVDLSVTIWPDGDPARALTVRAHLVRRFILAEAVVTAVEEEGARGLSPPAPPPRDWRDTALEPTGP